MASRHRTNWLFVIILGAYCLYAAAFIHSTSFVLDGTRYYCLFDDAMVSMRYAKNLAHGQGLVWNPGEPPVEGYTNPLWVLYMTAIHWLPLHISKASLPIQISGAVFLWLNLFFVKRIAERLSGGSAFVTLWSVALTAFFLSLNNWGLQGMEVSLLTLILSLTVWKGIYLLESGGSPLILFLLLGFATWVRLDMIVPYLVVYGYLAYIFRGERQSLVLGAAILLFFIGSQTLFRLFYYGDFLPNTYDLKMTGFPLALRLERGLEITWQFITNLGVILFLAPFAVLLFKPPKPILLIVCLILGQMAYSLWVGGDAWEYWGLANRYLSVIMPLFFILLALTFFRIEEWLNRKLSNGGSFAGTLIRVYTFLAIILTLVVTNTVHSPNASLREWLLIKPPLAVKQNRELVQRALAIRDVTSDEARIAVVWAGSIPYFSGRPSVDLLGKNDRVIAGMPVQKPEGQSGYSTFYPGHMKWDYKYSIDSLKPDVIVQFYGIDREQAELYLRPAYSTIYLDGRVTHFLNGSDRVHWISAQQRDKKY
jgi:hypothetical protein